MRLRWWIFRRTTRVRLVPEQLSLLWSYLLPVLQRRGSTPLVERANERAGVRVSGGHSHFLDGIGFIRQHFVGDIAAQLVFDF